MDAQDPLTIGYTEGFFTAAGAMLIACIIFLCIYSKVYSAPLRPLAIGTTMKAFCSAIGQKIMCRSAPEEEIPSKKIEFDAEEEECLLKDDPANWMQKRVGAKYGANAAADAFQLSRLFPFWLCMIVFCVVYDMVSGIFIQQGEQMVEPDAFWNSSTQSGIADGVFCFILMSAILYLIKPYIFDRCLGWELTPQRRIMLASVCACVTMLYSAILEIFRKKSPVLLMNNGKPQLNSEGAPVHDMSLLLQLPAFFLVALGESFLWPAAVEFFYTEMPNDFKAIGQGCFQLSTSFGALLNMVITLITGALGWVPDNLDDGHAEYFFFTTMTIAALSVIYSLYALRLYHNSGGRYEDKLRRAREAKDTGSPKTSNTIKKSWSQRSLQSVASRASLK